MNLKFKNGDSAKREELRNLLRTYNRSKREPSESQALDIYLEDEEGNLIAGLTGETFGNWFEIEYLFVKEDVGKVLDQKFWIKLKKRLESETVPIHSSIPISFRHLIFIKNMVIKKYLP